MKRSHLLLLAVMLPVAFGAAHAATVSDEKDARVDTLTFFNGINVTLHRVKAEVLENAGSGFGLDEALLVRATNRTLLAAQPILPGIGLPGQADSGLVADGVTPLLVRIASTGTLPAQGVTYDLALKITSGSLTLPGSLQALLKVAGASAFVPQTQVTLTPLQPEAFVTIGPIQPEQVQPLFGRVVAKLEVSNWAKDSATFVISRLPVALVHGYNVSDKNWGAGFTSLVQAGRASGLVVPVGYGIEDGSNTTASLWPLAATLDEALRTQVEEPLRARWAFTRYDVVAHSQGGVLARMLCSQNAMNGGGTVEGAGFPPWRNAANQHRGRFRRVVTIGSPHAGSTLGEMGLQLRNRGVPFGHWAAEWYDVDKDRLIRGDLDTLFQNKFRVGNGQQVDVINTTVVCDPLAKLHLVRTGIYRDESASPPEPRAPGEDGEGGNPLFYDALYLNRQSPLTNGKRPGEVVAPTGSDGVVPTESQIAGGGSNRRSAVLTEDIKHADIPFLPDGTSDTESADVAEHVLDLLDGSAVLFGSVSIPASLRTFMETRRIEIEAVAEAIDEEQRREQSSLYSGGGASSPPPSGTNPPPPPSDVTLNFTLQPPAGESPNGPVEWTAIVYGPDGVASPALTLVPGGTYGEQLALTIPAALVGQVVLSVRFPSTSGKTVIGTGQVVREQPVGQTLLNLVVVPDFLQGQVDVETPLTVRGTFDNVATMPIFTSPTNTVYQTNDPTIATVDASGRVKLVGVGATTIDVTYGGTLTDSVFVSVLEAAPAVVTPAIISGTVGQALTRQLAASQDVDAYTMDTLPPGLTLNAQSGLIEGTPTAEGRFPATLTVENANGRGSKLMEFVLAGAPGTPSDLGLDAASVSNGRPVGTVVGRLATVDPNPLDTFTYQLISGPGSGDNALFAVSGDLLVTAAVLSLTPGAPLTIRVRTTDSAGANYEKVLGLTIGQQPAITRQPEAQRVFVGESATFSVEASSAGPVAYGWRKDGVPIAGAESRVFEFVPSPAAAGSYSVVVTNADGSVTSAAAALTVDPVSYGRWASITFGAATGPLVQPDGDYNGDGIRNFFDYAFAVNPTMERGAAAQPGVTRQGAEHFFTYRSALGIAPLQFRLWQSADLSAWSEYVPAPADVTVINGGAYEIRRVRVPVPNPNLHLRLEVTEP